MIGRNYKTIYPDSSYSQSFYNGLGQPWKQVDPDGVTKLFLFNGKGQREYSIDDFYHDGTPHLDGTNRVTRTVTSVTTDHGTNVIQTSTYVWPVNNVDASNLLSQTETSVDGLQSWLTNLAGATHRQTTYSGAGSRTDVTTSPDNSAVTTLYQDGLMLSVVRTNGAGVQIAGTTFGYDPHNRQTTSTDARNGTTTRLYNNADQVYSVTTPAPGPGQRAQTTVTYF